MTDEILLYGHPACPQVFPIRTWLVQEEIPHQYLNIHQDKNAAARVRDINHGFESVPTLVFPDGSTLTEPSLREVQGKLSTLGYDVDRPHWILSHIWSVILILGLILAVARLLNLF